MLKGCHWTAPRASMRCRNKFRPGFAIGYIVQTLIAGHIFHRVNLFREAKKS